MKRLMHEDIFGMANLTPNRTGLSVDIWAEHKGISRNVPHNVPRAKIRFDEYEISVSIEKSPKILSPKNLNLKHSEKTQVQNALDYIGRNSDLFLKHFLDIDNSFDDMELFKALQKRGEFK